MVWHSQLGTEAQPHLQEQCTWDNPDSQSQLCLVPAIVLLQAAPSKSEPGVGTCNLYFKAPQPPAPDNILYLNGTGSGMVNNCCFPSTVAPSYAPAGQVRGLWPCHYS
jgi:hypothetical protein